MNKARIAIGLCSYEYVRTETLSCIIKLVKYLERKKIPNRFLFVKGTYIHDSRNKITKMAQDMDATHLLFIDGDMYFEPEEIDKLFEVDKDVVGCHYNGRSFPLISTIIPVDPQGSKIRNPEFQMPDKPFKVYAAATGFMLIKMEVFDKLKMPYFFCEWVGDKNKNVIDQIGDDVYFCDRVGKAGMEVWVQPSVKMLHIGAYMY